MLTSVRFQNFLSLQDVQVDLEPLTVIVGPNSCGKSTILDAINRFLLLKDGKLNKLFLPRGDKYKSDTFYSPDKFTNGKLGNSVPISFNIKSSQKEIKLIFRFIDTIEHWIIEGIPRFDAIKNEEYYRYGYVVNITYNGFKDFDNVLLSSPSMNKISSASYSPLEKPTIESDGSGLSTILSNLLNESPEDFFKIQDLTKEVIPSLKKIRIRREKVSRQQWFNADNDNSRTDSVVGEKIILDFMESDNVTAEYVSEGTLITIFLITCMYLLKNKGILLIDDIDRGLHPTAIKNLFSAIREVQKQNPALQIIATTHSPYLLDHLKPEEIRIANLDPERGTVIAKLTDHPEFEKWKEVMAPGEFWSYAGEDWVLKRNQESHE